VPVRRPWPAGSVPPGYGPGSRAVMELSRPSDTSDGRRAGD